LGEHKEMRRLILFTLLVWGTSCLYAQTSESSETRTPQPQLPPSASPQPNLPFDTLTNEQIKELVRKVAENDLENEKRLRDYTYTERQETHKLDNKGKVKSIESETFEVLQIYGETVQKKIAKNDQPLSAKDSEKEDETIQKIIDKRRNESDSDREKRIKKEEKEREEGREFVKEVADAYDFRLVGNEPLDGRPAWIIDATPHPGYEAKRREAKLLSKIIGRIWIDQSDNQLVKIDCRVTDTISLGLFLARLHEGTRIVYEQTRVNDEVWLPRHTAVHVDIRLALLKNFDQDIDVTDRDYKKFRAGTRIIGMEGVPQKP
jgi:hypothetical protein